MPELLWNLGGSDAALFRFRAFPQGYFKRLIPVRKAILLFALLPLAACGRRDVCQAPSAPKPMAVADLSLDQKADILGVPPGRVPADPKSAPSFGALMAGASEYAEAQGAYERYVARRNAGSGAGFCVENEAYKARAFKDELGSVAHAVMATCHSDDEPAALAAVLKYRNCAAGN